MKRQGASLIEMILVFFILSILLSLLLVAISNARALAAQLKLKNQIRQIGIAVALVESERQKLPEQHEANSVLMLVLLPKLGINPKTLQNDFVGVYMSDLDPSFAYYPIRDTLFPGNTSFAFNNLVFGKSSVLTGITDGTSGTVMCSERYARCGIFANIVWNMNDLGCVDNSPVSNYGSRNATFSDRTYDDILPVYNPASRTSLPSIPGMTFQVAPRPDQCDSRVVQASTRSGLVIGMMDGSVRTLSPSIDPAVYWSSMTPDKGEVVNLD